MSTIAKDIRAVARTRLMQQGLAESLAGRFETLPNLHLLRRISRRGAVHRRRRQVARVHPGLRDRDHRLPRHASHDSHRQASPAPPALPPRVRIRGTRADVREEGRRSVRRSRHNWSAPVASRSTSSSPSADSMGRSVRRRPPPDQTWAKRKTTSGKRSSARANSERPEALAARPCSGRP
jgi:hypothetical protein